VGERCIWHGSHNIKMKERQLIPKCDKKDDP